MSVLYWRVPDNRKRKAPTPIFYLGLGFYLISLFLPAVAFSGSEFGPGWMCAWMAFFGLDNEYVSGLAVFGGLINPLALAYIVLRIRDSAPDARWFLSRAVS